MKWLWGFIEGATARTERRDRPGSFKRSDCPRAGERKNFSPVLIHRWKRQYLEETLNQNNNDQEINKLKKEIAKLEQMIGKLTMENYLLKKEKEYIIKQKKENSSIITGPYFTPSRKDAD